MKKILSIFLILLLGSAAVFADTESDEYDDGYEYKINGAGDQQLRIELGGDFPINFGSQLATGGEVTVGYYRFLNEYMALGGEITLSNNFTIGEKSFISVPFAISLMFQPSAGKFEFPITLGVGTGLQTLSSMTYFPSFTAKGGAGCYYRFSESWSFGMFGSFIWMPEWFKDSSKNVNGFFATAGISARFHF